MIDMNFNLSFKIRSIVLLFVCFSFNAIQAQQPAFTPYAQLSYTKVVLDAGPQIVNRPASFGKLSSSAAAELQLDKKSKPLAYRLPLSIEMGATSKTAKNNTLSFGLFYTNFYRCDSTINLDRFSDNIDPSVGITNVYDFIYPDDYYHFRYNTVGINCNYMLNDRIGKVDFRIGFGGSLNRLLSSRYFFNFTRNSVGFPKDYTYQDISFKDKLWLVYPNANVQVKLLEAKSGDYWLTSNANFNIYTRRLYLEPSPIGSFISFGLRWESISSLRASK
jgi:hypothetical protein